MRTVSGLDGHKDSVFVCFLDEQDKKILEKHYGTLTPDLTTLRDALIEHDCGSIAMESTSIYWMPVWHVLESDFFVKNWSIPISSKQLPGRKSDVKDAQWIATVLHKGLLRGSLIPCKEIKKASKI
jgi:hypothetical protein